MKIPDKRFKILLILDLAGERSYICNTVARGGGDGFGILGSVISSGRCGRTD